MRRTLFSAVLMTAALALTGCVGQDSVSLTGQGQTRDTFLDVMNAVSGPSGENAGGSVSLEALGPSGPVQLGGPVTCLAVDGHDATFNFDEQQLGLGVIRITVHDGNPDTFAARLVGGPPPGDCPPTPVPDGKPLISGHISIVDSQPTPIVR